MKRAASCGECLPCSVTIASSALLHILGHAQRVAADINVRAFLDPRPQIAPGLAHAVLHVDLLLAVARPGERQAREQAGGAHLAELLLVEEVVIAALMAEEQPVRPARLGGLALLQEGAERRDAGAGPDHDDRLGRIGRQREMLRLLHIDLELVARAHAAGQESRADAEPHALGDFVAHRVDGERDAAGIGLERGGDRIDPRLQGIERFDEGFRVGPDAGEFLQSGEHVERGGVAVGIAPFGQRLGFLPPVAAGQVGDELEQHVGRRRQRHAVDQRLAQSAAADRKIGRRLAALRSPRRPARDRWPGTRRRNRRPRNRARCRRDRTRYARCPSRSPPC